MIAEDNRRNPYVGLRPCQEEDALYFYGRREPVDDLLDTLRDNHILGIVGSPGSGKTSLMNAGLLPAMLGGFLVDNNDRWRRAAATPGDTPLANLATALLTAMDDAATPDAVAHLAGRIRRGGSRAVLDYLEPRLEPNANLALLIDEFEAIFAFRDGDPDDPARPASPRTDWARRGGSTEDRAARRERARRKEEASVFAEVLMGLGEQRALPVFVVITMRAGFLGHCDLFNGLPEVFNRSRYLVPRMTREQLRDAVECPALLMNVHIAPRLVDLVLNELGDSFDRLPVLHHALMRSFDEWEKDGGTGPIDLPHFDRAGGFDGAIARDAANAVAGFDPPAVDAVLGRLVDTDPDGTPIRVAANLGDIVRDTGIPAATVTAIVAALADDGRHFVRIGEGSRPGDPRIQIAHESVIRQWPRYAALARMGAADRDIWKRIATRAGEWHRKEAVLLQGPELKRAVNWWETRRPTDGWTRRYPIPGSDFQLVRTYVETSRKAPIPGNSPLPAIPALVALVVSVGIGTASPSSMPPLTIQPPVTGSGGSPLLGSGSKPDPASPLAWPISKPGVDDPRWRVPQINPPLGGRPRFPGQWPPGPDPDTPPGPWTAIGGPLPPDADPDTVPDLRAFRDPPGGSPLAFDVPFGPGRFPTPSFIPGDGDGGGGGGGRNGVPPVPSAPPPLIPGDGSGIPVPDVATWSLMIAGFGIIGILARLRRSRPPPLRSDKP